MNGKPRNKIEERFDRESPAWREIYRRSGRNPFAYHDKQYRRRYVLDLLGKGSGRVHNSATQVCGRAAPLIATLATIYLWPGPP